MEATTVHELLDLADIPRTTDGEALSLSQRVALLVQARRDTRDILRRVQ